MMKFRLVQVCWRLLLFSTVAVVPVAGEITPPQWVPAGLLNPPAAEPWLCQGKYLTPEQGKAVLDAFLLDRTSREKWETFATQAKQHILRGTGLDPFPRRTDLTPVITNRREYDGYSVENVRFQSIPGYWVTGNLYRPLDTTHPHPAVLHTHGHSSSIRGPDSWIRNGRFKEDVQKRAAGLARMGAVSLTLDMVGYGDSSQVLTEDVHHSGLALTLHVWNAIRALDFLTGLEDVDASRLGVTGHSGGGTQAFLLSALDQRISVCVPVAMVSSWFFGGCACESGLPIHAGDGFFMNNVMIAALTAPRPLLIVSDGGDWSSNSPDVEFPFLQKIFGFYDSEDRVANVHLPDEGHDYGFSKRLAMYPFMATHLGLDIGRLQSSSGRIDEGVITVEDPQVMRCFPDQASIPANALRTQAEIQAAWDALKVQVMDRKIADICSISAYELRCDGIDSPLGIDSRVPLLSWKVRGIRRGAAQTAYRVQAAGSSTDLQGETNLLWDSGRVESNEQLNVNYGGAKLVSNQQVFWRVRTWDERGGQSNWSEPATFAAGVLCEADWDAQWIAHPAWLEFNRQHLGYRSNSESQEAVEKWIELDLGSSVPVDAVILRSLRHTVAERLGFPQFFKVEISDDPGFGSAVLLADYTATPFSNPWINKHTLDGKGAKGRYLRLTANRLRNLNGEICLALSQIEVISGGRNVAIGCKVSASDSIEGGLWSAASVVDGLGVPGSNPMENKTCLMRREFEVTRAVKRATVEVSGLGQYVLYLNGRRVGEDKLSPGWTETSKTVLYDSLDVLSYLQAGANAVGIALAGGMYSVPDPDGHYTKFTGRFQPLQALLQLRLEYADGGVEFLTTDENWQTTQGPTTYSHVYGGEEYDARLVDNGWNLPGYMATGWQPARITDGPRGSMRGNSFSAPPVRVSEVLKPVAINPLGPATSVYDLGQNASLMVRIRVHGPAGSMVRIAPGELLNEDGGVNGSSSGRGAKAWQYTIAGSGSAEVWESEFFYHGARYLEVQLVPGPESEALPVVESLEGLVTHTSAEPVGSFECSSELFNRTHELIRWAQRSNLVSVLTDCPHRERLGWLEQYHLNGPSLRYEFELARLFRKTFQDMADAQTQEGLVPSIAPEYIIFEGAFRDSPEWGSAVILAAWQQYVYSGDTRVLEKYYPNMKAYFAYLGSKADGYLLDHGLGDWYDIGSGRPGLSQLTPIGLTATATYYEDAIRLADIADILGEDFDAALFRDTAEKIREAFNRKYFNPQAHSYATGSQTANAMPYVLGLVPAGDEEKVFESIVADIRSHGNGFTSGDVGHRYLLMALAKGNRPDVVFDMHHQSDRPGYGYQLKMGATSLTEAWDAGPHSSQNHFMLGHIMEWFYHDLVGIAPVPEHPGFGMVDIKPQPVAGLSFARARINSVRGPVSVEWKRERTVFVLEADIPANTHARIQLPVRAGQQVWESSVPVADRTEIQFIRQEEAHRVYTLPSGHYKFEIDAL